MGSSTADADLYLRKLDRSAATASDQAAARTGSQALEIAVLDNAAAIRQAQACWRALEDQADSTSIFQTHAWCLHWAVQLEALGNSGWSLRVVTVRQGGKTVLIWPLAIAGGRFMRVARWMGEPLTQYGNILVEQGGDPRPLIERAWAEITSWRDVDLVWLRKVRNDAAVAPFLQAQASITQGEPETALAIDLRPYEGWDALNATYKAKTRKNRKRFRRRLDELGALSLAMHPPGQEAHDLLELAIQYKECWLEKRGAMGNPFRDELFLKTLCAMVKGDGPDVGCQTFVLRIDDAPVAIEIGFNWHGRYVAHIAALNPDYDKYGPGNVLTEDIICWLIERDHDWFDLMSPGDDYKRSWTNTETAISSYAQPLSLTGSLYVRQHLALLRPGLKWLHDRLPVGWRRAATRFMGQLG